MNLRKFYKQNIKEIAATLKMAKPAFRKLQSLNSRGEGLGAEACEIREKLKYIDIGSLQYQARYYNLAYALVRGKDISKVETNPRIPHDPEMLTKFMSAREVEFKEFLAKAEVAHETV